MHALLPQPIYEALRDGSSGQEFAAVVLFVDLSGFTTLERVISSAREGAELVAAAIDAFFTPHVRAVHAHGGFVSGFAGDAFTAVFPAYGAGVAGALAAATEIRDEVVDQPQRKVGARTFTFGVRIGVGAGTFRWWHSELGRVVVTSGSAVTRAVDAEAHSTSGEIVLHPSVDAEPATEPLPDGYRRLPGTAEATLVPPGPPPAQDPALLGRLFHPDVVAGSRDGEFRWVVTLFAVLDSERPDDISDVLTTAGPLLARSGGTLARAAVGDKGTTLLWTWGAPVAVEHPVHLAVRFIERLSAALAGKHRFRAGLTSERAFAGLVGGAQRAAYTCYGGGITLAARLCVAAPWGEVHAAGSIASRLDTASVQPLGPRQFKGFDQPIDVLRLRARRADAAPSVPPTQIAGREGDLRALTAHLDAALTGHGPRVIVVRGPAGVGKTTLLHELSRRRPGPTWLHTTCDEHDRSAGRAVDALVRQLLALAPGPHGEADLLASPRWPANLEGQAWCVAGWLGAPDPRWRGLDSKDRRGAARSALIALFAAAAASPLVLQVDDRQWMDAESRRILEGATAQARQLAVLYSARPSRRDLPDATDAAIEHPVGALSVDAVRDLAASLIGAPVATELAEQLHSRTAGNPFFVCQLVRSLAERDALERTDGVVSQLATSEQQLPADVNEVLVARLDRLQRGARRAVLAAAILGLAFQSVDHDALLGNVAERERAEARAAGILRSDGQWSFVHGLMRDAAYALQPAAQRRAAHARVAAILTERHGEARGAEQASIAHHLLEAGEQIAAIPHLHAACGHFRDRFDVENHSHWAAILRDLLRADPARTDERLAFIQKEVTFLGMAALRPAALEVYHAELGLPRELPTGPDGDEASWAAVQDVLRGPGSTGHRTMLCSTWVMHCGLIGQGLRAVTLARRLLAWAESRPDLGGQVLGVLARQLGAVELSYGELDQAIPQLQRARDLLADDLLELAGTYDLLSVALWRDGRNTEAAEALRQAHAVGERLGRGATLAHSYFLRGLVLSSAGDLDGAVASLEEAVRRYGTTTPPIRRKMALLSMGLVRARQGRTDKAWAACRAGCELECQDNVDIAHTWNLIGRAWTAVHLGQHAVAGPLVDQALALTPKLRNRPSALTQLYKVAATLALDVGTPETVPALLDELAQVVSRHGGLEDRAELTLLLARSGPPDEVEVQLAPLFERWQTRPNPNHELDARLLTAEAALALADPDTARSEVARVTELLDTMGIREAAETSRRAERIRRALDANTT